MKRDNLVKWIEYYVDTTDKNYVKPEVALSPEVAGMRMYDTPIVAFGDAADPLWVDLQKPQAVGPHLLLPRDWLPSAKTVISIFVPIAEGVRRDNKRDMQEPSESWLHARIEGQEMITALNAALCDTLRGGGNEVVSPLLDKRLRMREGEESGEIPNFSSNWSERHAAFVCGLGTFGLSKGLITRRGVAGRYTSVITDLKLPATVRAYTDIYEYCSMCGVCARNCPAGAISLENGKDHAICSAHVDEGKVRYYPRYGCGKCQVGVPCETRACTAGNKKKTETV